MVALVVALIAAGIGALPVAACSCMEPGSLADYANEPGVAIVAGWVGPSTPNGLAFRVERWYAGAGSAPILEMVPGDGASCGVPLSSGQHLIAVAYRDEQGRFHPSICAPYGMIDTPEGQALVTEADRTFGVGPTPPPVAPPPVAPTPDPGAPWPLLGLGGLAGLGLVAGLLVVRRRQTPPDGA
jgi:hypothetical protein